ncbi:MaoC family dehydratase [Streptacidiphilus rugosus]|uniref:MaoC family dehydratase n=1 Tax=Streptacidiphilus rugosus TaxID=405783 RepID=UPI000564AA98|nr:MaoC/PaaZ C-terminal domain-containing protein [Streptacidiphilus rugosus]
MTEATPQPVISRDLPSVPGAAGLYARALLPKPRRQAAHTPERAVALRGAAPDAERLHRYRELCGFTAEDRLPVTYPHLTAFPLSLVLMTARDFPLPLLGLVHLANRIEQRRPIAPDAHLDYRVSATAPRGHPKGQVFEVVAEVAESTGPGDPVWRSVSTYLHRSPGGGPAPRAGDEHLPAAELDIPWSLPAGLGRAYAAVSGDRNPIHLHPLTARLFGFRRAIAHGMWTKARSLAALEPHLPDAFTAGVDFRRPVLLPGAVRFRAARLSDAGWSFQLTDPTAQHHHLLGRVTPH